MANKSNQSNGIGSVTMDNDTSHQRNIMNYQNPPPLHRVPVVVHEPSTVQSGTDKPRVHIRPNLVVGLSVTQIVAGILGAIFNIIGLNYFHDTNILGHNIWSCVLYIVTASIAIQAVRTNGRRDLVAAAMVLNIISAVIAFGVMGLSARGIDLCYEEEVRDHDVKVTMAMDCLMLICGTIVFVVSIIASVIIGKPICCPHFVYTEQTDMVTVRY